ncbi:DoxX family protein [Brevibacterium sp. UCMA 11752]|uniref:DoxX family protein n=1 Tax=Brevibacterium sp. UCMA 11752 TaxID=2745946 RepID=UPI001F3E6CC3|nr:DoxX family membrane protein [Brevibacterium sp. UCMA 11752]MCF2587088.1 DoxX family protein [Brevibacterium sp. UCMA 11752]
MAPLAFLLVTMIIVHLIGRTLRPSWRPWKIAVRAGVVVMFLVTGSSHFIGMRAELVSMVPPSMPAPEFLVTLTGVLELAGALGLLWAGTRPWAAGGLSLMLIAMFPANIYKALSGTGATGTDLAWDDTLLPRTALQAIFLAATSSIFVWHIQARRGVKLTSAPPHPPESADRIPSN